MAEVVVLVPRRADGGHRDRVWAHCRAWWELEFGWPIFEGESPDGPFNRSAAINRAARAAGDWGVALVIDSDVLCSQRAVEHAVHLASLGWCTSAFDCRKNMTKRGTLKVLDGDQGTWERHKHSEWPDCISGALAVPGPVWDQVGGFDEQFVGWNAEDSAFIIAVEAVRPVLKVHADAWHFWHEKQPEALYREQSPLFVANQARLQLYRDRWGDHEAIQELRR